MMKFLDLPREIRDEIYRHYFSTNTDILLIDERQCNSRLRCRRTKHATINSSLQILDVSRQLRDEAEAAMFRFANFGFGDVHKDSPPLRPSQHMTERVRNVTISIDMDAYNFRAAFLEKLTRSPRVHKAIEHIIAKFGGTALVRKKCHLKVLYRCSCSISTMNEDLIDRIRALPGFEEVAIDMHIGSEHLSYTQELFDMTRTSHNDNLVGSLGPGMLSKHRDNNDLWVYRAVYYPQLHHLTQVSSSGVPPVEPQNDPPVGRQNFPSQSTRRARVLKSR